MASIQAKFRGFIRVRQGGEIPPYAVVIISSSKDLFCFFAVRVRVVRRRILTIFGGATLLNVLGVRVARRGANGEHFKGTCRRGKNVRVASHRAQRVSVAGFQDAIALQFNERLTVFRVRSSDLFLSIARRGVTCASVFCGTSTAANKFRAGPPINSIGSAVTSNRFLRSPARLTTSGCAAISTRRNTVNGHSVLTEGTRFAYLRIASKFSNSTIITCQGITITSICILAELEISTIHVKKERVISNGTLGNRVVTGLEVCNPGKEISGLRTLCPCVLTASKVCREKARRAAIRYTIPIFINFNMGNFRIIFLLRRKLMLISISLTIIPRVCGSTRGFHPPYFTLSIRYPFALSNSILYVRNVGRQLRAFRRSSLVARFRVERRVIGILQRFRNNSYFRFRDSIAFRISKANRVDSYKRGRNSSAVNIRTISNKVGRYYIRLPTLRVNAYLLRVRALHVRGERATGA